MLYVFDAKDEILGKIKKAQHLLVLTDYDGTLTPIVERPELAKLDNKMRTLLREISKISKATFGILSGRNLEELKNLIKVDGILYAGNHGFEIEGPNVKFVHPVGIKSRAVIVGIFEKLKKSFQLIEGCIVEDKGFSLSVHYRMVPENRYEGFKRTFDEITSPYLKSEKIKLTYGKKVFEVRPPVDWDKGKALKWIAGKLELSFLGRGLCVVYMGDDVTDEDAFDVLGQEDLPIYVGEARTSRAKYFLKSVWEVKLFLSLISKALL